ncbi:hypothetical protein [Amphibacillus indicireducens]|uniref:Uncharacterized protein n=1 Tax=Amphibacillus indicireducens TaxID=1076330 RepID=A0ABP7VTE8_9BACI
MTNLERLVNDLQSDWNLIGEFFDNAENVFEEYNLNDIEKQSLRSRNLEDLNALGVNEQLAVGALSGAHSSGCHAPI